MPSLWSINLGSSVCLLPPAWHREVGFGLTAALTRQASSQSRVLGEGEGERCPGGCGLGTRLAPALWPFSNEETEA